MPAPVAAILALLVTALAYPPSAQAAFSTPACQGADVSGRGPVDALAAQNSWIVNFENAFCAGAGPTVGYEAVASAAGLAGLAERQGPRFAVVDAQPSAAQVAEVEAGMPAEGDEGRLLVVGAGVEAVAALVNFPNGCDPALLSDADSTAEQDLDGDGTPDDVVRARFSAGDWEKVWARDSARDTWTDVFPELIADADCAKQLIRVVRFDAAGATVALKRQLATINPTRAWQTTYAGSAWPKAVEGARADCGGATGPGSQGDATDHLTSACEAGSAALVAKLIATDGSVGYAELGAARAAGLAITPEGDDNDTYWTPVDRGSGAFAEPTLDPSGFRTGATKGANCAGGEASAYPLCALTYGLLFEDQSRAYGASADEERRARTVKDYWESVLSDAGQSLLFPNDLAPLPAGLLAAARAEVEAIDWAKSSEEQPPEDEPPAHDPPVDDPPGGGGNKKSAKPSNLFSVPGVRINSRLGRVALSIKVPGPGTIAVSGAARVEGKSMRRVGRARRRVSRAGTYRTTVRLGRAARRKLAKQGKLKVRVTVVYKPRAGTARSSSRSLTLRATARRPAPA
jgi:hypothetical protein